MCFTKSKEGSREQTFHVKRGDVAIEVDALETAPVRGKTSPKGGRNAMGLIAWYRSQQRATSVLMARQRMYRAHYYFSQKTPALADYLRGATDRDVIGMAHMFSLCANAYRRTGIDARQGLPFSEPQLLPDKVIAEIMALPFEEFAALPGKLKLMFAKTPAEKAGAVSGL